MIKNIFFIKILISLSIFISRFSFCQVSEKLDMDLVQKMLPSIMNQPSARINDVINKYEAEAVEAFLSESDAAKVDPEKSKLPNPVMDGFKCIKNCQNNTGFVDVVIRLPGG